MKEGVGLGLLKPGYLCIYFHIGAKQLEVGVVHPFLQDFLSIIELVVTEGGISVARLVHQLDDGKSFFSVLVNDRIAREHISATQYEHILIFASLIVQECRYFGVIVNLCVHIVGRIYYEGCLLGSEGASSQQEAEDEVEQ